MLLKHAKIILQEDRYLEASKIVAEADNSEVEQDAEALKIEAKTAGD